MSERSRTRSPQQLAGDPLFLVDVGLSKGLSTKVSQQARLCHARSMGSLGRVTHRRCSMSITMSMLW